MGIVFEWSFLSYSVAAILGIILHEPIHLIFAYIVGGKNIKIGIKNKGNLGFIKYNLNNFSSWKVRLVGLAPIITAAIVTITNYNTFKRLELYCLAFGLIIYVSWKDISLEAALTGNSQLQKTYHSIPKYIRIFIVAWIFWQITNVLVHLLGGRGLMAGVVELGGQLSSLFIAYYGLYLLIFKIPDPLPPISTGTPTNKRDGLLSNSK
mgnify:CR=1 FL=1|jgi:hypothetical protein